MKTTVIIRARGNGYIHYIDSPAFKAEGVRCGLTPYEAAFSAARLMIKHAQSNREGGELMAPPEVMQHVPQHLRAISAQEKTT